MVIRMGITAGDLADVSELMGGNMQNVVFHYNDEETRWEVHLVELDEPFALDGPEGWAEI